MPLLIDIGNSHTHLGWSDDAKLVELGIVPTRTWLTGEGAQLASNLIGGRSCSSAALCSVVPAVTTPVQAWLTTMGIGPAVELNSRTIRTLGIDYPHPETIGADRLANALAAMTQYGAPSLVVDFGTAVTFDVVDGNSNYIGGIIAPGLSAMTDYLHEKTALLPRIVIRPIDAIVGKNTEEAMLIGAVHGYRGLVRELIGKLKIHLNTTSLPVVATGGYGQLIASGLPEITAVNAALTLEGLHLFWKSHQS